MKKNKLALFDIDDTLYKGPSTFHFAKHLSDKRFISQNDFGIIKNDVDKYIAGEIDYVHTVKNILKHFAESLIDKSESDAGNFANDFFEKRNNVFFNHTTQLFNLLQGTYDIYLVTSAPLFIAQAVMKFFNKNIKNAYGTIYESINGKFTGNVKYQMNKEITTLKLLKEYDTSGSLAFGDSADDIKMFKHVKYPVCFNPKDNLKDYAQKQSWEIVTENTIIPKVKDFLNT